MNPAGTIHELDQIWKKLRLTDKRKLSPDRSRLLARLKFGSVTEEELAGFRARLEAAQSRSLVPFAEKLRCEIPPELPIAEKIPEIRKAIRENLVVIVCGATGSGKTTQLPKAALMEGFGRAGRIGCTQPRRIAAAALAARLAAECGCACGKEVGYKVRFDDRTDDSTVIKFMTDGILLAESRGDRDLLQYDCIILDEVHERTLNIDFLLGCVKLLLKRRKDIRILISSATLESERLSAFFGGAPVIRAEGRTYPVEDCYLPPEEEEDLPENAARAVDFLTELDPGGDILLFLPGEREITDCAELFRGRFGSHSEILPLFGRLSAAEQAKIFRKAPRRRIVLSTNVAETSLTIPGIRFVIDSGLVRLSRYNPKSRIQELRIESVSQASAMQRRGRCGRTRDGVCVRLYSEEEFGKASPFTDPEIMRSSLAGVILQMAVLRLPSVDVFPFVDPPTPALIREGMTALRDLGALDKVGNLTNRGRLLASIGLDPHLGAILLSGREYGLLPQLAVTVSFLSIQDPRERPLEETKAADAAHKKYRSDTSDFLSILYLWNALREETQGSLSKLKKFTKANYLNFRLVREWRNLAADLMESMGDTPEVPVFDPFKTESAPYHKALMSGLPRHLACRDPESAGMYSDMNGKKFLIFPGSGLAGRKNPPGWLLVYSVVETSRTFARCVAEVEPGWLEETAPSLCRKIYDRVEWDETAGFVYARERVCAGRLLIHPGRRRHYGKVDPEKAREVFIRDGLVPGRFHISGTWAAAYLKGLHALHELEIRKRRPDSLVDPDALMDHFMRTIPPDMCSLRDLKQDWTLARKSYAPDLKNCLWVDPDELDFDDFPDSILSGGFRIELQYAFDPGEEGDGITFRIPETHLNLLDRNLTDYPPPGYMKWKIQAALRALPKSVRKEIMPLSEAEEHFLDLYRRGKIFTGQPFARTLEDFLREEYGLEIDPDIPEEIEYPEYLKIRIALLDEKGNVRKILKEIPRGLAAGDTTVSRALPGVDRLSVSGARDRAELPDLPRTVTLSQASGKTAFPALVDEGESVGTAVFLDPAEAERKHRAGLVRLIRLRFPGMIRQFKSLCRPTSGMELTLFLNYRSWLADLTDHSILSAFGKPPWEIRSAADFEEAVEAVRDEAAGLLQRNFDFLRKIEEAAAPLDRALRQFRGDDPVRMDVQAQLDWLFRDGFLRTPEAVAEYPRWLKAAGIRLERARTSPGKDAGKGAFLSEYIRKFHAAVQSGTDPCESPSFLEFFLLLEEARIAAWSPEIPVRRKATAANLKTAWESLRV